MVLRIVGRSSSHFTRATRMFAHELGVDYEFRPVLDLSSRDVHHYADNPALKIPVLQTPDGPWFGALSICRELARRTPNAPKVVWPEQLLDRTAANAQELVLQGMSTEVVLIMQASGGAVASSGKAFESLVNSLGWLDANLSRVRASAYERETLSIFDLTTFCFVTHLAFRKIVDVSPYLALQAFCDEHAHRPAARATAYRFDASS